MLDEPAHDGCLLRLGEAFPAIVNTDEDDLVCLAEVELQAHVVPLLDHRIAFLPGIELDENRCLVHDQINLTVLVRLWHLRVTNFQFCFI